MKVVQAQGAEIVEPRKASALPLERCSGSASSREGKVCGLWIGQARIPRFSDFWTWKRVLQRRVGHG